MEPSVFKYALSCLGLTDEQVHAVIQESRWDASRLYLYHDARSTLNMLNKFHFVGLIANQSPGTRERLQKYGIYSHFDLIFASDEVGIEKPDPRIFELALKMAGCRAEDAWMIGDRLDYDIRPARQAGWHTIRIMQGYNTFQNPRDALDQPDHTVENLAQTVPILCIDQREDGSKGEGCFMN
jgi:HAD superfamily hydrolase (TIGR01549 family)